jgi:predicted nucleotidyltransferase
MRLGSVDSVSTRENGPPFGDLVDTLKRAVAALRDRNVPYVLGGGLAIWARGGPESDHDLDFMVKEEDADRALQALIDVGMTPEKPPEGWLYKAFDENDVMVDLIFHPIENPVTEELLARGEELEVKAIAVNVMSTEDVFVSKLLALREHELEYGSVLKLARAVREQVDWDDVRARTEHSPFARAFFTIAEGLELIEPVAEQD